MVREDKILWRLLESFFESNDPPIADSAHWHDALPENRPIAGNRPNSGCDLRRLSYGAGALDFFILIF